MFIYDDDGQTAVNAGRIRLLYIDRIKNPVARTDEEHDKLDAFQLKAYVGDKVTAIISEVTGKDDVRHLIDRMHQITDGGRRDYVYHDSAMRNP